MVVVCSGWLTNAKRTQKNVYRRKKHASTTSSISELYRMCRQNELYEFELFVCVCVCSVFVHGNLWPLHSIWSGRVNVFWCEMCLWIEETSLYTNLKWLSSTKRLKWKIDRNKRVWTSTTSEFHVEFKIGHLFVSH